MSRRILSNGEEASEDEGEENEHVDTCAAYIAVGIGERIRMRSERARRRAEGTRRYSKAQTLLEALCSIPIHNVIARGFQFITLPRELSSVGPESVLYC